jgi:hypothetical protein
VRRKKDNQGKAVKIQPHSHPNHTKELNNSIDPLYLGTNRNLGAWPIPNIIGVSKKQDSN